VDVFDLGWKLTAVLRGYGGEYLLQSHDNERRAVAKNNLKMVEKAIMEVILPMMTTAANIGPDLLLARDDKGVKTRNEFKNSIENGKWIHNQEGTWMDYRYNGSPVILPDLSKAEPIKSIERYTASTWPGSRAPHVFLADGKTSIFDHYGRCFSIVDFTKQGVSVKYVFISRRRCYDQMCV